MAGFELVIFFVVGTAVTSYMLLNKLKSEDM